MLKVLIIRFSSIGDIVLTTPVIRCLKNQHEGIEIHYLAKKQFESVLKNNPYIDKLWLFDDNLKDVVSNLQKESIDYVIDLHKNLRSGVVKRRMKVKSFSFNKINFEKWLSVNLKINRLPDQHIVDRYMETTKTFNIVNDGKGLDYFIREEDENIPETILSRIPEKFIGLVIGAQHSTKKMPSEILAQICDRIHYPIVILGGPSDSDAAEKVTALSKNEMIIDLSAKLSLNQSAFLVKKSALIISHDTGLMHIASAYKRKIISIWGNTIPELGMYPYMADKQSEIFEVKDLSCRPCSKIGFDSCPKKHFKCMMEQDVEGIAERANALMLTSLSESS